MMAAISIARPQNRRRSGVAIALLTGLLVAASVIHLGLGARYIAPQTVVQALTHYDPHNFDHRIVVTLRL
ncbi:iron ABC transporter permease, partial [Enterobacter hormaechei]|nr:iron ABC transporter permease [Enterobacter hormaechei]